MGYRIDGWGSIPNKDERLFLTHPAFYTMGILRVEQLGHEGEDSPPLPTYIFRV
jgi:hypothetical protein